MLGFATVIDERVIEAVYVDIYIIDPLYTMSVKVMSRKHVPKLAYPGSSGLVKYRAVVCFVVNRHDPHERGDSSTD